MNMMKNKQKSLSGDFVPRPKDTYEFLPNNTLVCNSHDNTIQWSEGERLDHLYEQRCDSLDPGHLAVSTEKEDITFLEMDARANRLARYLIKQGVKPGDRIGVLFNKSANAYIAMLGIHKAHAAYVPLDAGFPQDRIGFIVSDSEATMVLSLSQYKEHLSALDEPVICLDEAQAEIDKLDGSRLSKEEKGEPTDLLAYIIYTSGSTGNPKGVAIDHPSICNFVRVAADVYGIIPEDRMYQGMTLAFDFSVEEIWVPLLAGATLIPGQSEGNLVGQDLADFIKARNITAVCCVPTLLATIDEDLPNLRFLLVSGEACPQDIVRRWWRPDRILLNAYGPTEATVTCTITELYPDKPVTIGGPLPTYSVVILPEDRNEALPKGEVGELCVTGIGLARGYLNLPERTSRAFIPDFLELDDNPSHRIYRTGDLARINDDNEIEYLGRIDTQVKVRGYRIELSEIESVIMQVPEIAQAVVNTHKPEPGVVELAAYYTLKDPEQPPSPEVMMETMRAHLPGYMVPSYLIKLDEIPMLPSHKADRKKLPPPTGPRFFMPSENYVEPEGKMEEAVAAAMGEILTMDKVSVEDHFFQDLGAHSLLMAKFAALLRGRVEGIELSMRDIYLNPTVRQLAAHLETSQADESRAERPEKDEYFKASSLQYYTVGTLQFLYYVAFYIPLLALGIELFDFVIIAPSISNMLIRMIGVFAFFTGFFFFYPIVLKHLLIGKWKPQKIKLWTLDYFRFWVVKDAMSTNPMMAFAGTPIYNAYLRLLGADIGRNVVNFSRFMPVPTDLIKIGDNTILQKDSVIVGYKAENGYIHIGPISIGSNCYIGESAMLDIHSEMGDNCQLGHTSSIHSYQKVPDGKNYHGSPAIETTTNYKRVDPQECTYLRKFIYCMWLVIWPLVFFGLGAVLLRYFLPYFFGPKMSLAQYSTELGGIRSLFALDVIFFITLAFVAAIITGFAGVLFFPRVLNFFLKPEKEYPLYGIHYVLARWVQGITNASFYKVLLGDSSYKPFFFQLLGWKQNEIKQTGSNFGLQERFDNPYLCEIGSGTMVSDGLSMINLDYSSSSFKLRSTRVGANCFIGNDIHYPGDSVMGDNCLFATKAMIPIDGPVRENVGILGSPSFEIPRATSLELELSPEELEKERVTQLPHKNKHNLITMGLFLFFGWFAIILMFALGYFSFLAYTHYGLLVFAAAATASFIFFISYAVLIERVMLGFKKMQPKHCTIYDPYFWKIERYWKHCENGLITLFKGTPFKPMISRMLGMKVGKRVFDDGMQASERTMVELGDYAIINSGTFLQCHSLEDGFFKSDRIKVGNECTVGVKAYVHYGTEMKEGSILEADSFLMKGEVMEEGSVWEANPAHAV